MHNSKWQIMGQAAYLKGSFRVGDSVFTPEISIPEFYKKMLKTTTVKLQKTEKFFRIGEQSAITILTALLALKQLDQKDTENFCTTAVLGYGNSGSHHGNLIYWHDYVENGRVAAQGHLFVGTLASTPLCQLALSLGCHAPVFYVSNGEGVSALADELDFIHGECENLFLLESDADFCNCLFLRAADQGEASENIVLMLEKEK